MFFSEIYQPGVADFDPSGKFGYEAILRILENTAATPTARATTSLRKAATASPGC